MKKVKKGAKAKKKEVKVAGEQPVTRLDKFARGGHVKKGHKTQVNVIVGGAKDAAPTPVPVPVPAGGPMVPPPGAPMPRMKSGGKVPHMTAGALSGKGRLQKTAIQKNQD